MSEESKKFDLTSKYDEYDLYDKGISFKDHLLLYIIVVFFVVFLIWANLTKVDEITRGEAKIIPSSQIQVIQNLEGGIIEEFLVKEGDIVEAGQVLIKIKNLQAKSDYNANNKRFLGIKASIARLTAETKNKPLKFSDDIKEGAPEAVATETAAYNANKRQQTNQKRILEEQIRQRRQEIREIQNRMEDLGRILKLSEDEKAMIAPMVARGAASKMELLQIDRTIAQQRSEINSARTSLPRAKASVAEAQARIRDQTSTFRANAQAELAEESAELNTIKETLYAYKDKSRRTAITSPVKGTVKEININTVGGVIKPGDDIMEIVPMEDKLLVEANVKPSDIAFLYPGQKAIIKITAYDFSIYGGLEGKVFDISADTIEDKEGENFYRVRVVTDQTTLNYKGKENAIIPGMTASMDIITGKKSVMNYLLKPFIKASQNALRER